MNAVGRACYVERNRWMIDESDFAIFHLDENNYTSKSGTLQAYQYAQKRKEKSKRHFDIILLLQNVMA